MRTAFFPAAALLGTGTLVAPIANQGSWMQTLQARNLAGQSVSLDSAKEDGDAPR